jgi:RNA polymerase sigma factor (sigma-70 family)
MPGTPSEPVSSNGQGSIATMVKTRSALAPAADAPDDVELARRIGQRDERAFELLMRRHNQMLYRIARSILRDDAEAEDAVQESYLAAFRNIDAFRGASRLSTWLARVVINESYGRLRKRKRGGVVLPFDAASAGPGDDNAGEEGEGEQGATHGVSLSREGEASRGIDGSMLPRTAGGGQAERVLPGQVQGLVDGADQAVVVQVIDGQAVAHR